MGMMLDEPYYLHNYSVTFFSHIWEETEVTVIITRIHIYHTLCGHGVGIKWKVYVIKYMITTMCWYIVLLILYIISYKTREGERFVL